MKRIGPKMQMAADYVATYPGCSKLAVARHVFPRSPTRHGYPIVNRAIKAGLIESRHSPRRYYLYRGPALTAQHELIDRGFLTDYRVICPPLLECV